MLLTLCMVLTAIPISGAVDDQSVNTKNGGEDSIDGLTLGANSAEVKSVQNTLEDKKPFGENGTDKILGEQDTDKILKLGAKGDKVKEIQQWLTDYGYYAGNVDGEFGEDTDKAVRQFQEEAGVIVDGVVGDDTKKAMENWDKYVAEAQAAAGETTVSDSSSSNQASYSPSKRSYAYAVRSYNTGWSGSGDCWDISNAAYNRLTSSGVKARIIQYRNSYVSNHRSVQVYQGGNWVDYENVPTRGSPTKRLGKETIIKS